MSNAEMIAGEIYISFFRTSIIVKYDYVYMCAQYRVIFLQGGRKRELKHSDRGPPTEGAREREIERERVREREGGARGQRMESYVCSNRF